MSWDSATGVLYSASPTLEQIDALSKFVDGHADELRRCYAPEFSDQRSILAKFVSRLFVLLERQTPPESPVEKKLFGTVERAADLLTREDFFKGVFHYAFMDADVALLELVYSALFTEIVFNSSLTSAWFEKRLEAERRGVKFSPVAEALNTLISVQFLDVRQDWAVSKPQEDLLLSIDEHIAASTDLSVHLAWTLALYFMAQRHYTSDTEDDGINIEPLMRRLQSKAGIHWSQVLKDQLKRSLNGLQTLVSAMETIRSRHSLQFVSGQLLAQTVADVVSCLFIVLKPTESLCAALASAVEPYPALQQVQWIPEQYLALTKAKCPSSIGAIVSIAQTMDLASRIDYLREMRTYVCAVDAASLGLDPAKDLNDSLLGSDVRTQSIISVLPARITDHQGTLELDAGTRGTLLAFDGDYCLVMWYFNYNGWSLLGRILENADLIEENEWKPLTVEILKLVTTTVDVNVLTAMSAGLARGDIVDLVAARLQEWIHSRKYDHCSWAFNFLAEIAEIDAPRIWTLLYKTIWSVDKPVLEGLRKLIIAVWPSLNLSLPLHADVMNNVAELFGTQYLSFTGFDSSSLDIFEMFLPQSSNLKDYFLSPSSLREAALAPLLTHLDQERVLDFCTYCIKVVKGMYETESEEGSATAAAKRPAASPANGTSSGASTLDAAPRQLSYLERQLFAKSSQLAALFLSQNKALRRPILELWAALVQETEAPPLLAFLDKGQATELKDEFCSIASNKLESTGTLASLALLLKAAERQESLLDLLRNTLLPQLEDRVQSIEDPESLVALLEALKLVKGPLKPSTLSVLVQKVEDDTIDNDDSSALKVKKTAIEILTNQLVTNQSKLTDFVKDIEKNTPQLVTISGSRPSLHSRLFRNLKSKWPVVAADGDTTATFDFDVARLDVKLSDDPMWHKSYRPEVLEANSNKALIDAQADVVDSWCRLMVTAIKSQPPAVISGSTQVKWACLLLEANTNSLPIHLQRAEDQRTLAASKILQQRQFEKSLDLLDLLYHQLTDLTLSPGVALPILKPRLKALMEMAVLVLTKFEPNNSEDPKIVPILLGLLDTVVIKQLQIFGETEDTLELHLVVLNRSLELLKGRGSTPRELVQSMTESASDVTALRAFKNTPVDNPWMGELILRYIQEWLHTSIMTDNFVRNGLMNVLLEAPLSRKIQHGGIVAYTHPALHSIWRHGILPIVGYLLSELESRISQETWLFIEMYAMQISTTMDQWKSGQISTALIDETMLLSTIIRNVKEVTKNKNEVVDAKLDNEELAKTIDLLLSHQKYLVARTSPNDDFQTVVDALRDLREWLA